LKETAGRVAAARSVTLRDLPIHWQFKLPALGRRSDIEALSSGVNDLGVGLVIVDPVYLCLTSGGGTIDPRSIFEMGPRLAAITEACAGATLVLVHHANRKVDPGRPMELHHLSYAGLA